MSDDEQATSASWQRLPMPEQKSKLPYTRRFSSEEYTRMVCGRKPETMEGKWFIYLDNAWIWFHRGWTGLCVYQVRLEQRPDGYHVSEAWVNRDPEEYGCTDDAYDAELLNWVIEFVLLGNEELSCPLPPQFR